MASTPTSTRGRDERRQVKRAGRRRRRGGQGRGPLFLQRIVQAVGRMFAPVKRVVVAAVSGDKPLVVALLGVIALGVVLLSGPTQNYLDSRARGEVLQMQADVLAAENERLGQRAEDLLDDETIELLAREQQGFIRPGEVPYALVPPEVERPRITAPRAESRAPEAPWYARAWTRVESLLGG